jgi:hypothetical protein
MRSDASVALSSELVLSLLAASGTVAEVLGPRHASACKSASREMNCCAEKLSVAPNCREIHSPLGATSVGMCVLRLMLQLGVYPLSLLPFAPLACKAIVGVCGKACKFKGHQHLHTRYSMLTRLPFSAVA